ncbi:MAG TPA: LytR C-terminal domain-containing protein [Fibrobacter sp.]|nr:LytR C-terminal domain-containing protein [Fibrobacter sp.]
MFLLLIACLFGLASCKKEAPVVVEERSYTGSVEVLNSCGKAGAASQMALFLRNKGFDVVQYRNDRLQNYEETIIAIRNPQWEGADALAQTLKTKNILPLKSKRAHVDATVYIGKNFNKIIEQETP